MRTTSIILSAFLLAGCGRTAAPPEPPMPAVSSLPDDIGTPPASELWPMTGHDRFHSGCSTVDFPSAGLRQAWAFRGTDHTWSYEKGGKVWSSAVVGRIDGREIVFAGSYDHSVYAIDAQTGDQAWRFTAGWAVYSAPAVWMQHDPPMVFAAAADRTIYGLDARTGRKLWAFECMAWSDGATCRMSSVTLAEVDGKMTVFVGAWTSNPAAFSGVQKGELVALDAATGALNWRRTISTDAVQNPAVAVVDGYETVFVTTSDGKVVALSAMNGRKFWNHVSNGFIQSSPTFGLAGQGPALFASTRFHSVIAIDPGQGRQKWFAHAKDWIDSTPAFAMIEDRPTLFFGSYDRHVYSLRTDDQSVAWKTETGGDVCSSAAVAKIAGRPAAFIHSLDDHLYGLDATSGAVLWKQPTGKLMWTHIDRGDSTWASPCVAAVAGKPMLFFGSYDGNLYAFKCHETKEEKP